MILLFAPGTTSIVGNFAFNQLSVVHTHLSPLLANATH